MEGFGLLIYPTVLYWVLLMSQAQDCGDVKRDIVFLVDASGSIRDRNPADGSYDNWNLTLKFISNFVNHFTIGPDATQIGLVTFSDKPHNMFFLNTYTEKQDLQVAIQNSTYLRGYTNTSGALYLMRTQQFTVDNGARDDAERVGILVTDGISSRSQKKTIPEARRAKQSNITMYVVGITDRERENRQISSLPQEEGETYWLIPEFEEFYHNHSFILNEVVEKIEAMTNCSEHTTLESAETTTFETITLTTLPERTPTIIVIRVASNVNEWLINQPKLFICEAPGISPEPTVIQWRVNGNIHPGVANYVQQADGLWSASSELELLFDKPECVDLVCEILFGEESAKVARANITLNVTVPGVKDTWRLPLIICTSGAVTMTATVSFTYKITVSLRRKKRQNKKSEKESKQNQEEKQVSAKDAITADGKKGIQLDVSSKDLTELKDRKMDNLEDLVYNGDKWSHVV